MNKNYAYNEVGKQNILNRGMYFLYFIWLDLWICKLTTSA